ncbi:MAG: hypothetical protein ACI8XC_002348, partial [Gammaproteobacteria bacterium]
MKSPATAKSKTGKMTGSEDFDGLKQVENSLPAKWYYD